MSKVRGAAVGAGCNLAQACDFVHADETVRFAQFFPRVGLSSDLGGIWVLQRLVGLRQARELALLGDDVGDLAGQLAAFSRSAQARRRPAP